VSFGAVLAELDGGSAMAAIRCRIFRHAELSGPLGHRRVSLTPNHAELVMNPCFHTVCKIIETRENGSKPEVLRDAGRNR
jgi:hypothetical protein